jgi:putative flippase GtrA
MKIDKQLLRQVILYGIIGGASASLDYLLFSLMYVVININELIANVFSVHAGIAMSFFLNSKFNFKKTDKVLFRAGAFYLTGLFGLALSGGMLWVGGVMDYPVRNILLLQGDFHSWTGYILLSRLTMRKQTSKQLHVNGMM